MRRAGYEVRVLPEEDLGWEENPPTLIEFIRRDLRWCQGNMQYWHFLFMAGTEARQPLSARLRHADVPRLAGLDRAAGGRHARRCVVADAGRFHPSRRRAVALLVVVLVMWFAPKIATVDRRADCGRTLRRAFGGTARFLASVATETMFFILLSPIMWFGHTLFLAGLLFGRAIGWIGQMRDDHAVSWSRSRCDSFWPHTAARAGRRSASLAATHPAAIPYALFLAGGLALSIPLAVITAHAGARRCVGAHRPRPAAGGNRAAGSCSDARAAGDRGRRIEAARGLTRPCSKRCGRRAGSCDRCGIYYGDRQRAPPWIGSIAASCGRAIWCSTSAPMSATASPRSAGWARAWSRSSRSRRSRDVLKLLYGRDRSVVIERAAVGRDAGTHRA